MAAARRIHAQRSAARLIAQPTRDCGPLPHPTSRSEDRASQVTGDRLQQPARRRGPERLLVSFEPGVALSGQERLTLRHPGTLEVGDLEIGSQRPPDGNFGRVPQRRSH